MFLYKNREQTALELAKNMMRLEDNNFKYLPKGIKP